MILTIQTLQDLDACDEQIQLFALRFGKRVNITEELCASVAGMFMWSWAARNLLTTPMRAKYNLAYKAARDEYERICTLALEEYDRVCDPALSVYSPLCATAWEEYKKVCVSAATEYTRMNATTFARLYNLQQVNF